MNKHLGNKLLSLYMDDKIDAAQKEFIDAHLSTCPICSQSFSLLKSSLGLLKGLSEIKESEHFDFEFKRRLEGELEKRADTLPLPARIREVFDTIRPVPVRPIPVLVKAVAVITLIAVFMGTIVWDQMGVVPAIASVEGDVRVYSAANKRWEPAKAGMRIKDGDMIRVGHEGRVNIESDKYEIMLKENTEIKALRIEKAFAVNKRVSYGIDRGKIFIATKRGFRGSNIKIDSPVAEVSAKNTGFMVKVTPEEGDKTWVGVLDGKVEVKSKIELAGLPSQVVVDAGKATEIEQGAAPRPPRYQNDQEWRELQDIYGIGDHPMVILLISMTPRRVHELLRPAGIYISEKKTKTVPRELIDIVNKMNEATLEEDKDKHLEAIRSLEDVLARHPNPKYNTKLLFFISGYYYYIDEYERAIEALGRIIEKDGESGFESLALCAKALIYEEYIGDHLSAAGLYKEVLSKYPDSLEAKEAALGLKRVKGAQL